MTVDGTSFGSFIQPIAGRKNRFLIAMNEKAVVINWDGHSSKGTVVKEVFSAEKDTNLDGFTVGPNNDFFTGNFANDFCASDADLPVYQYLADSDELKTVATGYKSTTGLIMNEKTKTLYHLDSCTKTLSAFDYDSKNRRICKE